MVTNAEEESPGETFAEAFPHLVHDALADVVTGSKGGDLVTALFGVGVGISMAFAPLPWSVVGIVCVIILVIRVVR